MIWPGETLIEDYQLLLFTDLQAAVKKPVAEGGRFSGIDIEPQFADTRANWESEFESIFTGRL